MNVTEEALPASDGEVNKSTGLVESVLENMQDIISLSLTVVRSTDEKTGTLVFVSLYIVYCLSLIFLCKYWYAKKTTKRTRKPKNPTDPLAGKRSSQRIRLQKHELVFIERITPQDYEKQRGDFTREQIEKL